MKSFYLAWQNYFRTLSDFTNNSSITDFTNITVCEDIVIGPLTTDQFDKATLDAFLAVQFTHHYEILQRTNTLNERLFQVFLFFTLTLPYTSGRKVSCLSGIWMAWSCDYLEYSYDTQSVYLCWTIGTRMLYFSGTVRALLGLTIWTDREWEFLPLADRARAAWRNTGVDYQIMTATNSEL